MTKLSSLSCLALIALLISTTTANANIQTIQNTLSQGIKISPTETAQNDIQNLIKVANVSFITDFEENNADFAAQDAPEKSSKDICIALGYRKTSCPDGMRLFDRCHNDTRYFRDCVCNECADFPYTKEDIPNGYVITESCQTCDTMKYKAALNPCEGFVKCEKGPAPNAQSCMSGETVKYSQCCQPLPDETDCPSGSDVGDDGCGGKRIICHNPCANVTCGSNEQCKDGICVCNEGYELKDGLCTTIEEDLCANVTCESPQVCKEGKCICEVYISTQPCPKGQICEKLGVCGGCEKCIQDPECASASMVCPDNTECTETDKCGFCTKCGYKDPCANVTCGSNEHCSNGTCVCDSGYELKSGKCEAICQRNPYCYNGTCPGGTKIVDDNCGGKCAICPSILCTEAGYKTGINSNNCETWTTCSYSDNYRKCTKEKEDRTPTKGHRQPTNDSSTDSDTTGTLNKLPDNIDTSLITGNSCASEVCPIALRCTNGCASYTKATKCCPAVCKTCKSTTSTGGGGGRIHHQSISNSVQQNLRL